MNSSEETLRRLDDQIAADSEQMIQFTHERAAGKKNTREVLELQAAIDIKVALTGGLRRS